MKEQEINFEVKSQEERTNKLLALNTEFKNKIKLYLASQGISENAYWMRPNPTIFNFCIITCTKETAELIQQMPEVGHIEEAHGFQAN
ncbi:MAG: hypothetical protein HY094_08445 [Candidatus Melainabacteria bacterium]|nr:hypothetical protein [Candidatus Melainabacteria bacterium]